MNFPKNELNNIFGAPRILDEDAGMLTYSCTKDTLTLELYFSLYRDFAQVTLIDLKLDRVFFNIEFAKLKMISAVNGTIIIENISKIVKIKLLSSFYIDVKVF